MTPEQRFWPKVDKRGPDDCWPWLGNTNVPGGYGRFNLAHRQVVRAHRYSYELLIGPIPDGLQLDHLCRNTACVNPAHLEPVTRRENLRRGMGFPGVNARKTHCIHGHEFNEANTYLERGRRKCRACHRDYMRSWVKKVNNGR